MKLRTCSENTFLLTDAQYVALLNPNFQITNIKNNTFYRATYMDGSLDPQDVLRAAFPILCIGRHSQWSASSISIAAPLPFSPDPLAVTECYFHDSPRR